MKLSIKKTINILLYSISVFIFQEMVFRYCFPIPEIENFDRVNYMKLQYDGGGSKHARDQNRAWMSFPDTTFVFEHVMNRYGFRDQEWLIEKSNQKQRALFIGDSFIEGVMAEQNETIPKAFEKASNQTFETLNGGMIGCGLSSYLQLAADAIPIYRPDVAFLCIYSNDLGKQIPKIPDFYLEPEYFNVFIPRIIEISKQVNKYGPLRFRWKKNTTSYLQPIPDLSNPWTNNESYLKNNIKPWLTNHMKKATFNPFLTNALFKEEKFLKAPPSIGESIRFFKYTCEQQGTKPIIIYIPSRNQVSDYYLPYEKEMCLIDCPESISLNSPEYWVHQQFIEKQCKALQISFIDLTQDIRKKEQQGTRLYWNYDQHMRGKGYQFLGQTIWKAMNQNTFN